VVAEFVRVGAERLREFAQALAAASTTVEVQALAAERIPGIVGASACELAVPPERTDDGLQVGSSLSQVLAGPDGDEAAELSVWWRRDSTVGAPQRSVFVTLADLVQQTLGRTMRAQQRLDVLSQMQRELLADPDPVAGLDVAVGYEPALTDVGLGGDFYDLVVSDGGRVFAVIGDITGHGPRAVAVMSELRSVIHHLLRSDAPLPTVLEAADRLLARRQVLATAQIFEIDPAGQLVRYVNAGHPYPVVRRADGAVELLHGGHRALLGLVPRPAVPTEVSTTAFDVGDSLLLYTDGLVERRNRHLDDAIDRLIECVTATDDESMAALVQRLQQELASPGERSDDDIAVLAIRHVGIPAPTDEPAHGETARVD
jgi:serine phosphatase RsbU (regulator of sigma subunit)